MATVRDDRGVVHELRYPKGRRSCRMSHGERLARRVMVGSFIALVVLVPLGGLGLVAMMMRQIRNGPVAGVDPVLVMGRFMQVALVVVGCGAISPLIFLIWPGRRARIERAARMGDGVCAACEYNLGVSEREDDGCVVCSECGAAWRG